MKSIERVEKAINRELPDCLPVGTFMGNHAAILSGISICDFYTNSKKMFKAQMIAQEEYDQDIITFMSDNYYIAEGFGTEVIYHDDTLPSISRPAVSKLKEVAYLKVPNPEKDGRMHVYLEAEEKAYEKLGNNYIIRGCGTGPFSLASHIMGTQEFLLELAKATYGLPDSDEKAIIDLIDISAEALFQFSVAQLKAGCRMISCGDSLASLDMISPEIYKRYVFPVEYELFKKLKPYLNKYKAYMILHICGDNTKILEDIGNTGTDCFEVDHKIDMATCKEKIGEKVCLIGNLDPTGVILQGAVQEVECAARLCINAAAKGGGFILGSGCEVPWRTPPENIKAMVRLAHEYKY